MIFLTNFRKIWPRSLDSGIVSPAYHLANRLTRVTNLFLISLVLVLLCLAGHPPLFFGSFCISGLPASLPYLGYPPLGFFCLSELPANCWCCLLVVTARCWALPAIFHTEQFLSQNRWTGTSGLKILEATREN
jgi:hypothetical protein